MVRSACMIEPHRWITWRQASGVPFPDVFFGEENGFVVGGLCFVRRQGDEIPFTKPR